MADTNTQSGTITFPAGSQIGANLNPVVQPGQSPVPGASIIQSQAQPQTGLPIAPMVGLPIAPMVGPSSFKEAPPQPVVPPKPDFKAQLDSIQKQAEAIQASLQQKSDAEKAAGGTGNDVLADQGVISKAQSQSADTLSSLQDLETMVKGEMAKLQDPSQQQQSFVDLYNQLRDQQGLPALDTQVVNLQNIMTGTENDIRNEIGASGGFATESQIQALTATRNKVITQQLNALSNLQAMKQGYVDKVMTLTGQDRQAATDQFNKLTGLQDKLLTLENTINNTQFNQTQTYQKWQEQQRAQADKTIQGLITSKGIVNTDDGRLAELAAQANYSIDDLLAMKKAVKTGSDLTIEKAMLAIAQSKSQNDINGTIQSVMTAPEGSAYYKIASDLAQGKITPTFFNSMISRYGSRGLNITGLKMGLYNLAQEINPNFDETKFEIGLAFDKRPATQTLFANITTANNTIDSLLGLSEGLKRSDLPIINQVILPTEFKLGNKNVSTWKQGANILADEVSLILGGGVSTDMRLKLGYDLSDPNLSPSQFSSAMSYLKDRIAQKKQAYIDQGVQQGVSGSSDPSSSSGVDLSGINFNFQQ